MGFKKAASAKQSEFSCGKCDEKFVEGKDIYMQQRDDKSWFSCHNLECFKSQGGTVEEKKFFGKKSRTTEQRIEDCHKFIAFLAELQLNPTSSDLARVFSY